MSAQAGVWNFGGAPASRETLANISQTIAQYGPDGESTYFSGPIGTLYRPFHTTKESRLERQPHVFSYGRVILWDGRLDNREELIPQLRGDIRAEQTDLAIVTAAYELWGTDCFRRLVGDWALSIWDPSQRMLILARDYIGVRHLYYYPTGKRVIWCTYLAPLVLCGDRFTLNEEYIAGYLALYPEAHLTPYREIRAVPPGSFVSIRPSGSIVRSYWAFNPRLKIRYKADAEYEEHFRHVFCQAIRRRLRSDSPILADLSGGLDSSSIVCMADDIMAKEGAEAPRLDTISFYDPTEPDSDERPYFSRVEDKRGRRGHHFDASTLEFVIPERLTRLASRPGDLGDAGKAMEEYRRQLIEKHNYRVLLSGIGGDEFLGGVPNPAFQLADLIQQFRIVALAKQLVAWALVKRRPLVQLLWQALVPLLPTWARAKLTPRAAVEPWIDASFAKRHRLAILRLGPANEFGFGLRSHTALARTVLVVSRQMASAAEEGSDGAERRMPYLDLDLIEFLLAIPAGQLLRPGERRSLMRRALAGVLPEEILHRRTKAVRVRKFLTGLQAAQTTLEELFCAGATARFGIINPNEMRRSLARAKNGDTQCLIPMLKAIVLELWLQDVLGRRLIQVDGRNAKQTLTAGRPESASHTELLTPGR